MSRYKTFYYNPERRAEDESLAQPLLDLAHTPMHRRTMLKLMSGSLAGLGMSACKPPVEEILPYVVMPEHMVPGKPLFYATALNLTGYAQGVLVETHTGRPTKIEGNPRHPASFGATDVYAQADLVNLYDPNRSRAVRLRQEITSWSNFARQVLLRRQRWQNARGESLRVLTPTVVSPSTARQIRLLQQQFPRLEWHQYEPVNRDALWAGSRIAFGRLCEPQYLPENARVILALDADFLNTMPGHIAYARAFAERRQPENGTMNRLYAVESSPTVTGAMADHRLAVRAHAVEAVTLALAGLTGLDLPHSPPLPDADRLWLRAVAADLLQHRGECLVIPGEQQSPLVHALAFAINQVLGNTSRTLIYRRPVAAAPVDQMDSLQALTDAMAADAVESLLILGGNPVYETPVDIRFAEHLNRVTDSVYWGMYPNETARQCVWHIPATHTLESWGDTRAFDGTVTIQQPVMLPVFGGYGIHQLLALYGGEITRNNYDAVRDHWRERFGGQRFETDWRDALSTGLVADSQSPVASPELQWNTVIEAAADTATRDRENLEVVLRPDMATRDSASLEVVLRPDPRIWDGRYARNAWLQELPKPLTMLAWDNAALMSPQLAARRGVRNEDVVELQAGNRTVRAPVWIMPGHADGSVTLYIGYGQALDIHPAGTAGVNAYALQTRRQRWLIAPVDLRKTGDTYPLATTQHHQRMEGRQPVRRASLDTYIKNPGWLKKYVPELSLYPEPRPVARSKEYEDGVQDYAWAMSINLNSCIGCGACTIACQAENNIPVVGKQEVIHGREMHWIRVDRYYENEPTGNEPDNLGTYFQPVPCMHCENAPCEYVCPVGATVHDSEGLNAMIYNRCIGTRDCSQNCPYKVRRFNWLDYSYSREPVEAEAAAPLHNPDVTVRSRGVMEKCTYCVQRISEARREAKKENRLIRDGEVVTACQAACPTEAIVFGDLNNHDSKVVKEKQSPLDYALLAELNTRPRTTYKARIRNANPRLAKDGESSE